MLIGLVCRMNAAAALEADRAQELFDQGVAELKRGRFEAACAALKESYELDASLGALLAVADCLERWGKVHSAAGRFEQYVAAVLLLTPEEREFREAQLRFAKDALVRLEPSVPRVTLVSPAGDAEYQVLLDAEPLPTTAPEQDVRVDPGRHVVETRAEGRAPWKTELDVALGGRATVELELGSSLVAEAPEPAPIPQPVEPVIEAKAASPVVVMRDDASVWRSVGWGLGAVGITGLGVGTAAGLMVLQTCPGFECGSREERGRRLAMVADVGFGVGLATLAASVAVLVTTQRSEHRSDTAHWRPLGSLHAGGGWIGMSQKW